MSRYHTDEPDRCVPRPVIWLCVLAAVPNTEYSWGHDRLHNGEVRPKKIAVFPLTRPTDFLCRFCSFYRHFERK